MAVPKRAKKFRQKHLSDKIEQKKREKKHAQLVNSRKRKPTGAAPRSAPKVDLDVPQQELFDAEALDKYISDDEKDEDSDAEGIAAEEAEYLQGSDEEQEESMILEAELPQTVDLKIVSDWEVKLKKSPAPLAQIVKASGHEELPRIADDAALDALRALLLNGVPEAIAKYFPNPKHSNAKKQRVRATFKALADVLAALLTDIGSGAGAATDALAAVVGAAGTLLKYFEPFGREYRHLARGLATVVARADRDDGVKLRAFAALHAAPRRAEIAKIAYAVFVKAASKTSVYSIESLNLTKGLFSQLFFVNEEEETQEMEEQMVKSSEASAVNAELYQLAFQQIRQLALHLKNALDKTKNPDYDVKVVYTWPFVHSLSFWCQCVALSGPLRALVHPLAQVTLRVVSLVPSQQFLPLRFHLVNALTVLAVGTDVYIPVAPTLLDAVLRGSSVLSRPASRNAGNGRDQSKELATLAQPDFEVLLHVPQGYVGTVVYQNAVLDEFVDALVDSLVPHAKSIAFPELVAPVVVALRRFAKHEAPQSRNPRIKQALVALCERLDANAQTVVKRRAGVNFGPRDIAAVQKFMDDVEVAEMPLGKEGVARRRVRIERRKLARAGIESEDNEEAALMGSGSDSEVNEEDELEMEEAIEELEREVE